MGMHKEQQTEKRLQKSTSVGIIVAVINFNPYYALENLLRLEMASK